MSYARKRQYSARAEQRGSYWNRWATPQTVYQSAWNGTSGICEDVVSTRHGGKYIIPNHFDCVKKTYSRATISGVYALSGIKYKEMCAWPCDYQAEPLDPAVVYPEPSSLEKSNAWWATIARTNPAAADVSLPTFIGELKDVPSMLTGWGKTLSDKIFTSHLNWRWGIKPFVSDVKKMINFVELTNRRFKLLKRLQRGEIVKQRCALDSGETREPARRLTLSSTGGAVVSAWANTTYTYRTWGSMQWKLRKMDKTHPMTDERLLKKAKSMVLGWDSYELVLATWELIPWSWFIDWFFHLSDILTACKGVCTYQWANGCMMRTLTSTTTYDIENPYAPGQWWTCSGSHKESMVRRQRWPIAPVGPPIDVVGPLLTGKTWSILGTLWVLKSKSGTARALRS